MKSPYEEGRNAYFTNVAQENNPYQSMSNDWFDWDRGFYDAKQEDWEDTYEKIDVGDVAQRYC